MFWNEVDFSQIEKKDGRAGRQSFLYNGKPFRFQIPEARCVWGLSEYKSVSMEMDEEFQNWFQTLEKHIGKPEPFSSNLRDGLLRVKLDEYTQVFDSDRKLDLRERTEGAFRDCKLKCIMEVSGMYYFNGTYGLTCRIYQMLWSEAEVQDECAFIDPPAS
ncbi:hypothetical protein EBT31_21695 [bacterium]|nr:hypothetical protein [bacterium]NBX51612.1 hypothetical protein [bacterium]